MNHLTRFIINELNIRGQIIQLSSEWQQLLAPHHYPASLASLLGELTSATLMLASGLKIEGKLLAQIQSQGPVPLLVSEAQLQQKKALDHPILLRAYAHQTDQDTSSQPLHGQPFMEAARLTFTIWNDQERYQSVTSADYASLNQALEAYFLQSEQATTFVRLFADPKHACGLFLQHIPDQPLADDDWSYASELANTISFAELSAMEPLVILHRLFHELDIQVYDAQPIQWNHAVNRASMEQAIRAIPSDELTELLAQQNQQLHIKCEFTGQTIIFSAQDIAQLRQHET